MTDLAQNERIEKLESQLTALQAAFLLTGTTPEAGKMMYTQSTQLAEFILDTTRAGFSIPHITNFEVGEILLYMKEQREQDFIDQDNEQTALQEHVNQFRNKGGYIY